MHRNTATHAHGTISTLGGTRDRQNGHVVKGTRDILTRVQNCRTICRLARKLLTWGSHAIIIQRGTIFQFHVPSKRRPHLYDDYQSSTSNSVAPQSSEPAKIHFSLNSLSDRVLYNSSMSVSALPTPKIVTHTRCLPLPPVVSRCLPLSPVASRCLGSFAARV